MDPIFFFAFPVLFIKSFRESRKRQKVGNTSLWLKEIKLQEYSEDFLKKEVCICPVMKMTALKHHYIQPFECHSGFCFHNILQPEDASSQAVLPALSHVLASDKSPEVSFNTKGAVNSSLPLKWWPLSFWRWMNLKTFLRVVQFPLRQ